MHQATWTATVDDITKDFGKAQVQHGAVGAQAPNFLSSAPEDRVKLANTF